jgi:hypothetical protein
MMLVDDWDRMFVRLVSDKNAGSFKTKPTSNSNKTMMMALSIIIVPMFF